MAESKNGKTLRQIRKRIRATGAPYNPATETVSPPAGATTATPTPKKRKKTGVAGVIQNIKGWLGMGKKKGTTLPSGYAGMTPQQKKEWHEIMEETK